VLRLIGICAVVYLAYWAGMNGLDVADLIAYANSQVDTVSN